jgi:hypothetical protein
VRGLVGKSKISQRKPKGIFYSFKLILNTIRKKRVGRLNIGW